MIAVDVDSLAGVDVVDVVVVVPGAEVVVMKGSGRRGEGEKGEDWP